LENTGAGFWLPVAGSRVQVAGKYKPSQKAGVANKKGCEKPVLVHTTGLPQPEGEP
jgi:hypothetical protein